MNSQNSKHEAIKAAYGEYWEKVKDCVRDCGVLIDPLTSADVDQYISENKENLEFIDTDIYRPKALNGIERNNGWTIIEDEKPEISGEYWATTVYGRIRRLYFSKWEDEWQEITNNSISHTVSHWQNIEEPKPKVY
ncbi:hypothetical protein CMT57_09255 [Elizabethkingia anophelis]|nr:hypothetical protein [Elizabethkingia anophelis]